MSKRKLCRTTGCGKRAHARGSLYCLCHEPARLTSHRAGTMRRKYDAAKEWAKDFAARPGPPEWTPFGQDLLAALTQAAEDIRRPLRTRMRAPRADDRASNSPHLGVP